MISGPPPGRIAMLLTAWADWLFAKLSPPEPARTQQRTLPPKLVKSDRDASAAKAAGRR